MGWLRRTVITPTQAAALLDVDECAFLVGVEDGLFPAPMGRQQQQRKRWYEQDIKNYLANLPVLEELEKLSLPEEQHKLLLACIVADDFDACSKALTAIAGNPIEERYEIFFSAMHLLTHGELV